MKTLILNFYFEVRLLTAQESICHSFFCVEVKGLSRSLWSDEAPYLKSVCFTDNKSDLISEESSDDDMPHLEDVNGR
jgi:hypothetical protein